MSYYRSSFTNESDRNRDPRQRDRSRSEIRRPDNADTFSSSLPSNQSIKQEQTSSSSFTTTNNVLDFFKTLGLNSQLIQALINANLPKPEPIQQPSSPPLQQSVNNAQEFASFLSKSYGLDPNLTQPINRDPRRRQISTITTDHSSKVDRPIDPRSIVRTNSIVTGNSNNSLLSSSSMSIDESYKQFICSIDQTSFDDETRKRFQRIGLLENELDKLHRMNIELIKTSEKRSRRHQSTKDKDRILTENENLQNELIHYIRTLKTTMMNNYSTYMLYNTINSRQ